MPDLRWCQIIMTSRGSSVFIRTATEDDAEFFFQLELQTTWDNLPRSCGTAWKRDAVREALCATHHVLLQMPGNAFFIAEVEERRAGLLWFGAKHNHISGQEEGWVYNVTVRDEFRRRGIAKRLLARGEEYARMMGYDIMGMSVAVHNEVAQELYRSLGYEQSNIILRKPLNGGEKKASECAMCREGDEAGF